MIREPELTWFKSSYSSGSEGDSCVEVATTPGTTHVRDSKHNAQGPRFTVTAAAWTNFLQLAGEA
ncbi:DUF397 domain-containing protein [Streptomyces prunicolor]|uniref:DUF397 domain-containing protein n=1 Tax=Streptomyces prunicolor TaxID=67348 RepID=A0ABU4F8I7_9ACTN|nr:DUF397 domain-containing protein [Streptomyces prunicolor]MDV7216907.1 DUF397 domain-containing protein [Streptomyces prunicolor]